MNQEINNFLSINLNEAHATFNSIIAEMIDNDIQYDYATVKQKEELYYKNVCDIILSLDSMVHEYNCLVLDNAELFDNKKILYIKYILLFITSIIFIKLYHKIFNIDKFNEFLHYLVGLFLGGTFIGLLNKDLSDNMGDTKEKRELVNRLKTLKEEYKELHDNAVIIIDYIFEMNDKLWDEIDKKKVLIKK